MRDSISVAVATAMVVSVVFQVQLCGKAFANPVNGATSGLAPVRPATSNLNLPGLSKLTGSASANAPLVIRSGKHFFSSAQINNASSISISKGATAVIDFSRNPLLNVTGNLINSGSVYAFSTNHALQNVGITAFDIINNRGAILSTVLPAGLLKIGNQQNLGLSLSAIRSLSNSGSITSSGQLSLSAGNSIANRGAIVSAQDLHISAGPGGITNGGMISSTAGNINIKSAVDQNLIINNNNGTLQALLGNINLCGSTALASYTSKISITGGNVAAKAVNINAGSGSIQLNVDELQGLVNVDNAAKVQVVASTPNLELGKMDVSGDPTFYNTGGDITINSNLNFAPVNFVSGVVNIAIVAQGSVDAAAGVNLISTNSSQGANWNGSVAGGSILIVAGANFTASPDNSPVSTQSPPTPPAGDTTATLTITGASSGGGNINLSGVSLNTQSGQPSATSVAGNVTLVAYNGTQAGSQKGNISIGSITTGETSVPANDVFGLNGSVSIIGNGNVTVNSINTTGNVMSPVLANGNVLIASAAIQMLQLPTGVTVASPTTLATPTIYGGFNNTAAMPGNTTLNLSSITGISAGSTLYLDPQGPDSETATVQSVSGTTVTLNAPLASFHYANEQVLVSATNVVINPGAGAFFPTNIPVTQNGAIFAPGALSNGTITVGGQISGTGAITVKTAGQVAVNSAMTLSSNPTSFTGGNPPNFYRLPMINVAGNSVTVSSSGSINSSISGCNLCPNSTNIFTTSLTNSGTIGASSGGNMFLNISSSAGLAVGGGTFEVPAGSVIEIAAADKNALSLSTMNFSTGVSSLIILNAQQAGSIAISGTLSFTGAPLVSINTATLNPAQGSKLSASTSGGAFIIGSGFTAQPLTINVNNSFTISGAPVCIRPYSGQNLVFTGSGTIALPTTSKTLLQLSGGGTLTKGAITFTGDIVESTDPSGNIQGMAFQPYVGGTVTGGYNLTTPQFAAYPYQVVLDLLGYAMATQGNGIVSQQIQYVSTYTQVSSSAYVIQAARQLGLQVSAGAFVMINQDGSMTQSNFNTAIYDTQTAFSQAAIYGNVKDVVIGNEDIVAGVNTAYAGASMATLQSLITGVGQVTIQFVGPQTVTGAQVIRNNTTNPVTGSKYTSATLPVTTRQQNGVLNLVTDTTNGNNTPMIALMNSCEQYVYGNYYPFFDEGPGGVVATLVSNPSISRAAFTTLVDAYMNTQFDTNTTNFSTANVTPKIHVGETGWALPLTSYNGTGLPQQNKTWAQWYYQAMQGWSATHPNKQTNSNGVIIGGYFETYDEPWKGILGKNPNNIAVAVSSNITQGTTSVPTTSASAFFNPTLTPMSIVINPGNSTQEVQNYFSQASNTGPLTITSANFPATLVNNHNTGETIVAGSPQEPFFGIFQASGTMLGSTTIFQLTKITQQVPIAPYQFSKFTTSAGSVGGSGGGSGGFGSGGSSGTANGASSFGASNALATAANGLSTNTLLRGSAGSERVEELSFLAGSSLGQPVLSTTIIPTDVNPGLKSSDGASAAADTEADKSAELASFIPGIEGNAADLKSPFNNLQKFQNDLNPQDSFITFTGNNLLLAPDHDITVNTNLAQLDVSAGSAVFVVQESNTVAIYLLHDERNGAVKVSADGQSLEIPVGRQVLLSKNHNSNFDSLNSSGIGYRNLSDGKLGALKTYSSEFSLPAALSTTAIRQLMKSTNTEEQALAGKLLKTAAAMVVMGRDKSPFKASGSNH